MANVSVSEGRRNFSGLMTRSQTEVVFIEHREQPVAVMISPEYYERMLEALEDREDIAAFDDSVEESGPNIPWNQVKSDLGWV